MAVEIQVKVGRGRKGAPPDVLELRVHGVNNTTPAALLDLPPDGVELVAGDKLGSFWRPTAAAEAGATTRGRVPPGIAREAYSWGGMVRTVPNFGGVGTAGRVAGVIARILYALILPFSIGNAVEWTRRLTTVGERSAGAAVASALARLFGLVLTLVFTTAAVTLSLDILGAQCAATVGLCAPIQGLLDPLASWTAGQRLALFTLGPVIAIGGLWLFSAFSRQRYDVLPGMENHRDTELDSPPTPLELPRAVLSQPGFWANRITRALARAHVAASLALTCGLVAQHVAMSSGGSIAAVVLAAVAAVLLAAATVVVCVLPTMTLPPPAERGIRWPGRITAVLLALSGATLIALLVVLVWFTDSASLPADARHPGLYGAGFVPLVLIGIADLLALSGVFWRPWRGRRATAWAGCAPAVLMTLSLTLAVSTSAILIVAVGNALNGRLSASDLIRDHGADATSLQIPSVWVGLGAAILAAALVAIVGVLTALVVPRTVSSRARTWGAPWRRGRPVIPVDAGVIPLSQEVLFDRITDRRRSAALLHLMEPAVAILAVLLAAGAVLGWVWTSVAYLRDASLWAALPLPVAAATVQACLDVAMWGLGAVGVLLVAVLASGATSTSPRPLGIVWDIACYLPRTGQPFGPPCFAERAVPEIAGRMHAWLREDPSRRVVLVAHSMGAVLSVSALGLLASSPETRRMLRRVSLLTFGVQLRAYFGRILPELLGPDVLGVRPSRGPGFFRRDPWRADAETQARTSGDGATDRLRGTLLADAAVPWVNLWRLTDYLGFPAASTVVSSGDGTFRNQVDRYAQELDTTGYMVEVGTHGEYFRAPEYDAALLELAGLRPA